MMAVATSTISFDPDFASPVEWAQMYRSHGIQIVPGKAPKDKDDKSWKRPDLAAWASEHETFVPDFTFSRWYGDTGEYNDRPNMGIVTGRGNALGNLFVIDLDTHKNPDAAAWWKGVLWENNGGHELKTWSQTTGGGGRQIFFRAPAHWRAPTNRTSAGVDIRGQGGFAVLPPSLHNSGRNYDWDKGLAPYDGLDILDAPQWLLDAVDAIVEEHGGTKGNGEHVQRTPSPSGDIDPWGNIVDGREDRMTKVVWAAVVDWHRECPIRPPKSQWAERAADAYAAYEFKVAPREPKPDATKTENLDREDRGPSLFRQKWKRAMAQWDGKVAEAAKRPQPHEAAKPAEALAAIVEAPKQELPNADLFEWLDVSSIKALPDPQWLIGGLVVEGATGFIFGAPGSGKTFVALNIALSISVAMPDWWGRKIERTGPVIYISSEGQADLKFRIAAWEQHHQVLADPAPFYLIRQSINFMSVDDVQKLVATVDAIASKVGNPVAVFVDTVSRVLPGADENLQKDMTLFIRACDAVRERFGATVIGVHHTSRAGNLRGSTVFEGAGDFLLSVEREKGERIGKITAEKIKAAEDGWSEAFAAEPVDLGFGHSSLVAIPCAEPVSDKPGWPDKDKLRKVLSAVNQAWASGHPWSPYPQSKREGRYMPRLLGDYGIGAELGQQIMEKWLETGVLTYTTRDSKSHSKGLQVAGGID